MRHGSSHLQLSPQTRHRWSIHCDCFALWLPHPSASPECRGLELLAWRPTGHILPNHCCKRLSSRQHNRFQQCIRLGESLSIPSLAISTSLSFIKGLLTRTKIPHRTSKSLAGKPSTSTRPAPSPSRWRIPFTSPLAPSKGPSATSPARPMGHSQPPVSGRRATWLVLTMPRSRQGGRCLPRSRMRRSPLVMLMIVWGLMPLLRSMMGRFLRGSTYKRLDGRGRFCCGIIIHGSNGLMG